MPSDGAVVVRIAGAADVAPLARLRLQWRAGERGEQGLEGPAFERFLSDWMEDHAVSHVPFLALREGQPIGMAWLALVDRVPGPEHRHRRSAYVQSVYVASGERSMGIGTLLMGLVLAHARGLGLDYLAVHPTERSFPFYRRLGFVGADRALELRL